MGFIKFLLKAKRHSKNLLSFRGVSTTEANRANYNALHTVDNYANWSGLLKPEQTILNLLRTKARFGRMLDAGVGGGRTTRQFSEIAEEYIGIDYSENMIKACIKKFGNTPKISFSVLDARDMSVYPDNYFDFVLFSHGGLDAVEHEDRLRILHEIQRVARPAGLFCFSTSNLDAMFQYCQIGLSRNLKDFAGNLLSILLTRLLNQEMWKYVRGKRKNLEYTMFIIGARGNWSLKTYCITLEAQVRQLRDSGFRDIRVYDLQGREITSAPNMTDVELYFLCSSEK